MQSLKVQITGLRALAHSGKQLYQPFKRHAYLYEEGGYSERDPVRISAFREFSQELQRKEINETLFGKGANGSPLVGYIDESRHIYDVKMPHFSYQVDRLLEPSSNTKRLLAMVRDVSTDKNNQPYISLTLLNSRLQGSKQIDLSLEESEFSLLGPLNGGNNQIAPFNTV